MKRHVVLPIAILAMCVLPAVAQSGPGAPDTLSALLVEVRALRVAMERAATTTPQIQLLAARLTVQNDRLSRATRDADAVHQELEQIGLQNTQFVSRAAYIQDALERETDPARLRDFKAEQSGVKSQMDELAARETQLRARESELSNVVAAEQTQWTELNRRLDDLERELAARRPR